MAHKAHPKGLRLAETKDWLSRWVLKRGYAEALKEDTAIRNFLLGKLKEAGVEQVEIERFQGKLTIIVSASRPGLIIGRGGAGIEELKKQVEAILTRARGTAPAKQEVRLDIREIKNPWESAALSAQYIASQLERRMPHRRVLKQSLGKIMANKAVQGARIEVAGRLGGANMSRREWVAEGRMPRQTLRANIDYALREAKTTYGTIGVKVWLYKGEEFE